MGFFALAPLIAGLAGTAQSQAAQQKAAQDIADVSRQNVEFIAEMGTKGVDEITKSLQKALEYNPGVSAEYIQRYADIGGRAFEKASGDILAGRTESPYTDAVTQAAISSVQGRSEFANLSPEIQNAIQTESGYVGEGAGEGMRSALLGMGREGLAAEGDISAIKMREAQTLGDLERQAGLSKSAALLGQVAPTLNQMYTGQDARLLSNVSRQNFMGDLIGQGAQFAGQQGWFESTPKTVYSQPNVNDSGWASYVNTQARHDPELYPTQTLSQSRRWGGF